MESHNIHMTTFDHPRTGKPTSVNSPPPTRTPPQSPVQRGQVKKTPTKSRMHKAPQARRGENSRVILKGWLHKQESGGLRLWKRKWCVLADFGLFFYKDSSEQQPSGSILLPSYQVTVCGPSTVSRKFAFKLEHENMKTYYLAADTQHEMQGWVETLNMASVLQRAPGLEPNNNTQKLVPKSPIMTWDDEADNGNYPRDSYRDPQKPIPTSDPNRPPLQPRDNSDAYPQGQQMMDVRSAHSDSLNRYPDPQNQNVDLYRGQPRTSGYDIRPALDQYPGQYDGDYNSLQKGQRRSQSELSHSSQSRDGHPDRWGGPYSGKNQEYPDQRLSGDEPYHQRDISDRHLRYPLQEQQMNDRKNPPLERNSRSSLSSRHSSLPSHTNMGETLRQPDNPEDMYAKVSKSRYPNDTLQRGGRQGYPNDRLSQSRYPPDSMQRNDNSQGHPNDRLYPLDSMKRNDSWQGHPNDGVSLYPDDVRNTEQQGYPNDRSSQARYPAGSIPRNDGQEYPNDRSSQARYPTDTLPWDSRQSYPNGRLSQSKLAEDLRRDEMQGYPSDRLSQSRYPDNDGQFKNQNDPRGYHSLPGNHNGSSGLRPSNDSGSLTSERRNVEFQEQPQKYNAVDSRQRHSQSRLPVEASNQGFPNSHSSPRQGYGTMDRTGAQTGPIGPILSSDNNPYMLMKSPQQHQETSPNQGRQPMPRQENQQPVTQQDDYASLQRVREWQQGSRSEAQAPRSSSSNVTSPERPQPNFHLDLAPHTYVNVYDTSRDGHREPGNDLSRIYPQDTAPRRPPLPAAVRQQIVQEIAQASTPQTQKDLLQAEQNLEHRMQQPAYFDYPTRIPQDEQGKMMVPWSNPNSQQFGENKETDYDFQKSPSDTYVKVPYDQMKDSELFLTRSVEADFSNNSVTSSQIFDYDPSQSIQSFMPSALSPRYVVNQKEPVGSKKYRSDLDMRTKTFPAKRHRYDLEENLRYRTLPDHAQSMPTIFHQQEVQYQLLMAPIQEQVLSSNRSYPSHHPSSVASDTKLSLESGHSERRSAFRPPATKRGDYSNGRYMPPHIQRHDHVASQVSGSFDENQDHSDVLPYAISGPSFSYGHGGGGYGNKRSKGSGLPAIHTVKEDPDMPDSDVIETELPKKKIFPLSGPRLRMSICADDLLGKNHDELVLLLIQLRRDRADIEKQRFKVREIIEKKRPTELDYRKRQQEGERIDPQMETEHRRYKDLKRQCEELDKQIEVYKPLVNLVSNMVTMGSLYGGDNLMLATEYRKHLLSPDQYSEPKKMIEFSRRTQEDRIIKEMEADVKQLTKEADLEEKLDRLYELDRLIQEQAYDVMNLKEEKDVLEKSLDQILKQQDQLGDSSREMDRLIDQQHSVEKELSVVLYKLAEASKQLEATTAENNRVEHEVALLRSKVNGDLTRSKSAPSLSSESLKTKLKMEKDLAQVQTMMEGLNKEGARLSEAINTLRSGSTLGKASVSKKETATYNETDLDTLQTKDLAQVTALLATYHLSPTQMSPPSSQNVPTFPMHTSQNQTTPSSHLVYTSSDQSETGPVLSQTNSVQSRGQKDTFHAFPVQILSSEPSQASTQGQDQEQETDAADSGAPWDISEADDNTKRFFGLIPKDRPKSQTVRDVKRQSDLRRDKSKKDEPDAVLKISSVPSQYTHSDFPVYENLPKSKASTTANPWSIILPNSDNVTGSARRRSLLHLMTPKPFTPFNSQNTLTSVSMTNLGSTRFASEPFIPQLKAFQNSAASTTGAVTMNSNFDQQGYPGMSKDTLPRPWEKRDPEITAKKSSRGRYMTISSTQPIKLEKSPGPTSPTLHTAAGDLITPMDAVPDIVKSSTAKSNRIFDEKSFEREIEDKRDFLTPLLMPEKVEIPERWIPDSDEEEDQTEEEKQKRQDKADKIKKILTQQSHVYYIKLRSPCRIHSISQPDVSKVAGEVHERVQQEKMKRAQLLAIGQELAEQVKHKSREAAAERRKTWSGSPNKSDGSHMDYVDSADDDGDDGSYSGTRYNQSVPPVQQRQNFHI
ncbi:hypothetical protein CHS0354_020894 [Potamilus streckersoni]|uniref:PH domain-containing protein n=1 Tax=Potamilus streckersoni TaxID=2493646 RepID=A0AAE0SVG4_9BIVA|nr:hypothetical protein CHS0354_020894 [Potamilus streckersoni]